ncbi:MAG TPA: signal peptidase I [Pirellula sp.]|nr:signal peptidase I [Pirellula sp.]
MSSHESSKPRKARVGVGIAGWIALLVGMPTGLFYLLATLGFVRLYGLPTAAMEPTVKMGDRFVVERISNSSWNPSRGDIITFKSDGLQGLPPGSVHIKRVVGLPGEQIRIEDGKLFINGALTVLSNVNGPISIELPPMGVAVVDQKIPAGHYFVVGDNATNSLDSRSWGTLPQTNITGRAVYRYFPVQSMGPLH